MKKFKLVQKLKASTDSHQISDETSLSISDFRYKFKSQ